MIQPLVPHPCKMVWCYLEQFCAKSGGVLMLTWHTLAKVSSTTMSIYHQTILYLGSELYVGQGDVIVTKVEVEPT